MENINNKEFCKGCESLVTDINLIPDNCKYHIKQNIEEVLQNEVIPIIETKLLLGKSEALAYIQNEKKNQVNIMCDVIRESKKEGTYFYEATEIYLKHQEILRILTEYEEKLQPQIKIASNDTAKQSYYHSTKTNEELTEIFENLKKHNFIDGNTNINDWLMVCKSEHQTKDFKPIRWINQSNYFAFMLKALFYKTDDANYITIGCNCFLKKDNKKFKSATLSNLLIKLSYNKNNTNTLKTLAKILHTTIDNVLN